MDTAQGPLCTAEKAMLGAASIAMGSLLVRTFIEPDVWWHIAIGRNILDQKEIPRIDQFAAAALGRPYHDSHRLFQSSGWAWICLQLSSEQL